MSTAENQVSLPRRTQEFLLEQLPFAVVSLEFLLVVLLVQQFHLESQTFSRVLQLSLAGFVVHHFLPHTWRLPFFAFLSLFVTVAVVDDLSALSVNGPGIALVAIGLGLLGICHLPAPFWLRASLIGAVGAALTVVRANYHWFPALEPMWAVLASMFIFRIMVYLYDLKNHNAEFSLARGMSYFFMLPNACFPLFPVVDYKTYCDTYYNDDAVRIYQSGVKWMLRGIMHLLLYRLVYHYGLLNIAEVRDAGDVAYFMTATYLLYLKVSGQFHVIVGLLHMFGFNLPETHHLYLLASSFTDFWRRINIYWKDFIMKLFFYPAFFALKRLGTVKAIAVGTLIAFFATWLLHSWQWFWFRGRFLFTWQDIAFWFILALLVLVNAVIEAVYGRRRTLAVKKFGVRERLVIGLKTAGTFVVICTLWTLWSSQSAAELQVLAECAWRISWMDAIAVFLGLLIIGIGGAFWGQSVRESSTGRPDASNDRQLFGFWQSAAAVIACSLVALVIAELGNSRVTQLVRALREDQLNSKDKDWQRRGYYEELDLARGTQFMWRKSVDTPAGWTNERPRLFRGRDDFRHCELIPNAAVKFRGAPLTTNRWGMRDRDYELEKPARTYRFILLGSSHELGSGVEDHQTFENIVENRLNREVAGASSSRFEILNMSVGGFSVFEKIDLMEQECFAFNPDAVIFAVCSEDRRFLVEHLANSIENERPIPYKFLTDLFDRARVYQGTPSLVIQHRLDRYVNELYAQLFRRLNEQCAERRVRPFVLFRPEPVSNDDRLDTRRLDLITSAESAGLDVLDLSSAFDNVQDHSTLVIAKWDDHTSSVGHQLLADELFAALAPRIEPLPVGRSDSDEELVGGRDANGFDPID